jgi:hypothetical protein
MNDDITEIPCDDNRGAIFRIFGVILVILGWLDTMLLWRGGFEIIPFHAMLIVTGLLLYMIGAIRRRKKF